METKTAVLILVLLALALSGTGQTSGKKLSRDSVKVTLPYNNLQECRNCQDSNVILYDFECKNLYYNNKKISNFNEIKLTHNIPFKIKVININRYYYDLDVESNDVSYSSEPPTLFKQLFLGDGSYINNMIAQLSDRKSMVETPTPQQKFLDALETFMMDYYGLMDINTSIYNYCTGEIECCDEKEKLAFSNIAGNLLQLKLAYISYNAELTKNLSKLQSEIGSCLNQKSELQEALKKEVNVTRKNIISEKIKSLDCSAPEAEKKSIEQLQAGIDKLWQAITSISDTDITKLILLNNNFVPDHFTYLSPPIIPTGNKMHIGIKISPANSSLIKKWNIMPLYNDSVDLNLFVRKKWFVSFSSGPYIGFFRNKSYVTYDWQPQPDMNNIISDSSRYKLVSTGNSSIPVGISAFASFGTKISNNFGLGFTTGVGLITDPKPRPVYMIGFPLFFGDKQQLNFSIGAIFTQKQKLISEIYPDMQNRLYSNKSTIDYKSTLGAGGFVSVSYTLFSSDKVKHATSKSEN